MKRLGVARLLVIGAAGLAAGPAWAQDPAGDAECVAADSQQGVLLSRLVDQTVQEIEEARNAGDFEKVASLAESARATRLCSLPPSVYLAQAQAMAALDKVCDAREPLDRYFSHATPGGEGYDVAEDIFEAARQARDAGMCETYRGGGVPLPEPMLPARSRGEPPETGDADVPDDGSARDDYRGGELNEGRQAYASGNYSRAAELFSEVIRQAPQSFEGYFRRAQAHERLGRAGAAEEDYLRAIELAPSRSYIVAEFARFLQDSGRAEAANQFYNDYLVRHPNDTEVLMQRGRARRDAGLIDLALEDFSRAIELAPDKTGYLMQRAHLYHDNGRFAEAVDDYTSVIEAGRDTADVRYRRGLANYALGRAPQAVEDLSMAIEKDPRLAEAYRGRGRLYAYQGNPGKAVADFTALIDLKPEDAEAYVDRAAEYRRQQDLARALSDYTRALRLDPDNIEALKGRAALYRQQGEYGKALEDLSGVIERNYTDADAYAARGWVFYNWKDCERAMRDFDKALLVDRKNRQAELGRQACRNLMLEQSRPPN
jgi:tetratricopeptide (TPR) repeat protein